MKIFRKYVNHTIVTRPSGPKLIPVAALIVIGVGVFSSYVLFNMSNQQHEKDVAARQTQQGITVSAYIQNKISSYEQVLLAGASLIGASDQNITRSQWQQFSNSMQVNKRIPEITALAYGEYVNKNEIPNNIAAFKDEGFLNYTIYPEGDRSEYALVKYIEPLNEISKATLGYDMSVETKRGSALSDARDRGEPVITEPIILKRDENLTGKKPNSIIMFYPVYKAGTTPSTVQDRRLNARGFVYISFRIGDMMKSQQKSLADTGASFYLSDAHSQTAALYAQPASATTQAGAFTQSLPVSNRQWNMSLGLNTSAVGDHLTPYIVFGVGLFGSVFFGGVTYVLLARRNRKINTSHLAEIQKTKDELLALASHQLRTPASGVKQYLGMLTQGYFGALTKEQIDIAKKAYASNERQLEIIDQLLYVAKADAGQLLLKLQPVQLPKLIKQTTDTFADAAKEKAITLRLKMPNQLVAEADPRYISMIVENLISNAIKYSYPKSKVYIVLKDTKEYAELSITDRGVGIDQKDIGKLFQKFSRIENPLSRAEGGSGLGLFLADKLAAAHNGTITLQSNLGMGSVFTLKLFKKNRQKISVVQLTE